ETAAATCRGRRYRQLEQQRLSRRGRCRHHQVGTSSQRLEATGLMAVEADAKAGGSGGVRTLVVVLVPCLAGREELEGGHLFAVLLEAGQQPMEAAHLAPPRSLLSTPESTISNERTAL